MTIPNVAHGTVALDRTYRASVAQAFAAWSQEEALLRWATPGEGWELSYERFDFRVGGADLCRFGPVGGSSYVNENRYHQIVPERRLLFSSTITYEGVLTFAGLVSVEFEPADDDCHLHFSELGAYLDGRDSPADHRAGWGEMLDGLGGFLELQRTSTSPV